jgi:hypothetical protein
MVQGILRCFRTIYRDHDVAIVHAGLLDVHYDDDGDNEYGEDDGADIFRAVILE